MRLRTFLKPLSFIPAILLMYLIFSFSAQEGDLSSATSYQVSRAIVQTADKVFDMGFEEYQISDYAYRINGVTRKLAHMTEYFLLAVAVSFPLYVYGLHGILLVLLVGVICVGFAAGDEYHQSFVAGRAASIKDVGIDSVGVVIGIFLVRIIGWTGRRAINDHDVSVRETRRMRREREMLEQERLALARERSKHAQTYYQQSNDPNYQLNDPTRRPVPAAPLSRKQRKTLEQAAVQDIRYQTAGAGSGSPYARPYPDGTYPPYPVEYPQPDMDMEEDEDSTSDDLSDDMPFARILKKAKTPESR